MERQALDLALDMLGRPFLTRAVQRSPLPSGIREVILLAACSEAELAEVGKARGRDPQALRQAAIFFLQQVLLFPGADSYRILGLKRGATAEEIHDHRRLLLKWLHPDRNPSSWEQMLFQRVVTAAEGLEQQLGNPPARNATVGASRHRQLPRSRAHRPPAVRRTQAVTWRARLRSYIRRAAFAVILLTLGGGAWRIFIGEPFSLSLTRMGSLLW